MSPRVTLNGTIPVPTGSRFSNSSTSTYRTFPVILKMIQVVVGLLCVVIAASDMIQNFEKLTARSFTTVAGSELGTAGRAILKKLISPLLKIDHLFIDQMACRIVFVTASTILLSISAIQLTWFPVSVFSGPMKSRIISGVVYHFIGFAVHIAISVNLLARINLLDNRFYNEILIRNVAWIGLILGALYLTSGITALWYLRGSKSRVIKSTFQPMEKEERVVPGKLAPNRWLNT